PTMARTQTRDPIELEARDLHLLRPLADNIDQSGIVGDKPRKGRGGAHAFTDERRGWSQAPRRSQAGDRGYHRGPHRTGRRRHANGHRARAILAAGISGAMLKTPRLVSRIRSTA